MRGHGVVQESLIYTLSNVNKMFSIVINKKSDHFDFLIIKKKFFIVLILFPIMLLVFSKE